MNIPTILTLGRVIVIPFMLVFFCWGEPWGYYVSAGLFWLASVTDWLDGYLARRWGQITPLGEFLDPVADKLLVSTALVGIVGVYGVLFVLPAAVIIAREITISALREWMAEQGLRSSVKVMLLGKFKTAIQMVAIWMLLLLPGFEGHESAVLFGFILLCCAALLTAVSMFYYLAAARKAAKETRFGVR
ncbi:MAG: CDP-diacylglycerol--glycerol-3-phosphate 3-phosphatidyltransferase [Pseudomonadota bacterium]